VALRARKRPARAPRKQTRRERTHKTRNDRPPVFHAILGPRAFEEVVDQLTFAIRSGVYAPGDRLPIIAELARLMEVSKPTVGLAIRSLADSGVLSVQRGATGGVIVRSSNIPVTLLRLAGGWRHAVLGELLEARRPIEMQIALLAGMRATADDFQRLRSAVLDLEKTSKNRDRYARLRADHLFHYSLGRAARNELLAYYQHQILEQLATLLNDYEEQYRDIQNVIRTHETTLAAIESRDSKVIRKAMEEHFAGLEGA
jgi:GntR family transcriptional regulator, transcriptional repressor for pyruvate dehydrogenase complex